jgi:hypothetical protein
MVDDARAVARPRRQVQASVEQRQQPGEPEIQTWEGGGSWHLADELQLVIAPLLVGQSDAVRMLGPAHYMGRPAARLRLLETRQIGDVVLLRYAPKDISTEPR